MGYYKVQKLTSLLRLVAAMNITLLETKLYKSLEQNTNNEMLITFLFS